MAENLHIEATKSSPLVDFNAESGILTLKGRILPEDPYDFFEPVLEWLKNYFKSPNEQTIFEFEPTFVNTTSVRVLVILFKILDDFKNKTSLKVRISFNAYDETLEYLIFEIREVFPSFNYEIVKK